MGEWLKVNGEAIYGTRPWLTFGEGPTKEPEGHFKNHNAFSKLVYSSKDLRYTSRGSDIYATIFGWPEDKTVTLESFAEGVLDGNLEITEISLIGYDGKINWEKTSDGIEISLPDKPVNEMAIVFKIKSEGSAILAQN